MKRIGQLFGSLLVALVLLGAVTTWWVMRPLTLTNPTVDISIEPQTTVRGIAQVVADSGVNVEPVLLHGFFESAANRANCALAVTKSTKASPF